MREDERASRPSSRLVAASCTAASVAQWLSRAAVREQDVTSAAILRVSSLMSLLLNSRESCLSVSLCSMSNMISLFLLSLLLDPGESCNSFSLCSMLNMNSLFLRRQANCWRVSSLVRRQECRRILQLTSKNSAPQPSRKRRCRAGGRAGRTAAAAASSAAAAAAAARTCLTAFSILDLTINHST